MSKSEINPYVGPRSFQRGEPLYGRDRDCANLTDLLISERIVLLYSPSGAGKSSLIQAGLIPALLENEFELLAVSRVNRQLPESTSLPEYSDPYSASLLLEMEEAVDEQERLPLTTLLSMDLDTYVQRRLKGQETSSVLILEQFEEILNLDPADEQGRNRFFRQLGGMLQDDRLWVLFTMREDYLAGLDPYLQHLPTRLQTSYRLDFLDRTAAAQAIQRPVEAMGIPFDREAVTRLTENLAGIRTRLPNGEIRIRPGRTIEPVQLQVVCHRLFQQLPPGLKRIGLQNLSDVADVDQALAEYHATQVSAIAQESGVLEREIRNWMALLITEQGIRTQVLKSDRDTQTLSDPVIRRLIDAHLVRAESSRGAIWLELAHDRLVGAIGQDNARWFEAHSSVLQQQAVIWDRRKRPDSLLLSGRTLMEAERETTLTPLEALFLQRSRQRRTRTRWTRAGVVLFCSVLLITTLITVQSLRKVRQEQTISEETTRFLSGLFADVDPLEAPGVTAQDMLRNGTRTIRSKRDQDPLVRARLLFMLARAHLDLNLLDTARELAMEAETLHREIGRHEEVFLDLCLLSEIAMNQGKGHDAEHYANEALNLAINRVTTDPTATITARYHLANALFKSGRFDQAEQHYDAILIRSIELEDEDLEGDISGRLGVVLYRRGDFERAEHYFNRQLELEAARSGATHPGVIRVRESLADLYQKVGRFDEAEAIYREIYTMQRELFGYEEHPRMYRVLYNLGRLKKKQGYLYEADALLEKAHLTGMKLLGEEHPNIGYLLNARAGVKRHLGACDVSEAFYYDALFLLQQTLGAYHPDLASFWNNLGLLLAGQGILHEAEFAYHQALGIHDHHATSGYRPAFVHLNLIALLLNRERYEEARHHLDQAGPALASLPEKHDGRLLFSGLQGVVLASEGFFEQGSDLLFETFLSLREKKGADHSWTRKAWERLELACRLAGKADQIDVFLRRANAPAHKEP